MEGVKAIIIAPVVVVRLVPGVLAFVLQCCGFGRGSGLAHDSQSSNSSNSPGRVIRRTHIIYWEGWVYCSFKSLSDLLRRGQWRIQTYGCGSGVFRGMIRG